MAKKEKEGVVRIPYSLTKETMHAFIGAALAPDGSPRYDRTVFYFHADTRFIDPTGVVVLANLFDYFGRLGAKITVRFDRPLSTSAVYLDDAGLFKTYMNQTLRPEATARPGTVGLERLSPSRMLEYLVFKLMPWIADRAGLDTSSIESVRVSFEEILNNIADHAGVDRGCVFAQFFPAKGHLQVAISDFGVGIPNKVRTQVPGASDVDALRLACREGFTTSSNVRNRGAGLPTLMKIVTEAQRGTVLIASGNAEMNAHNYMSTMHLKSRQLEGYYPGTLVKVILKTDLLQGLEEDVQVERFKW